MLWPDRHAPLSLEALTLHPTVTHRLFSTVQDGNCPHVLLSGCPGSGKRTRVRAMLHALYGDQALKRKVIHREFKSKSKTIDVVTISSVFHIELNPADVGNNDRFVVQEVIKEIAQTHNVGTAGRGFKVVVLNDVDRMSRQAQNALRRTMEKYTATCRLILVAESTTHIIAPLKSRCLAVRIPAPSADEIVEVLRKIAQKEIHERVDAAVFEAIASQCDRNLRRAILMLEAWNAKYKHEGADAVSKCRPDWEVFLDSIGRLACEEQTPQKLGAIRNKLYELLGNCIPPEIIMKTLTDSLLKRLDDSCRYEAIEEAAFYDHRLAVGTKAIFHLEAFVAKFMAIYKRWILEAFG